MVPEGAHFYGLKHFHTLFEQISQSKTVGGMLLQCSINLDSYVDPFFALVYCIYGGTPIYIQRRIDAMNHASYVARKHRPESIMGWLAAGTEELLNGAARMVNDDWGWKTELDKANSANRNFEEERDKLSYLQAIADNLKEKLLKWSEDNVVSIF